MCSEEETPCHSYAIFIFCLQNIYTTVLYDPDFIMIQNGGKPLSLLDEMIIIVYD